MSLGMIILALYIVKMKTIFIVITFITFVIFFMEALIHFNIGKNGKHKTHEYVKVSDQIKIHIPDKNEFFEIFTTVLFFSSMTGLLSAYIIKHHL
jgi:hypothetical protein